jgi:hypothetical protein
MSKATACWFIREGLKLRQCSKEDFDKAISEGKSIKYGCYADKRSERRADQLETSRLEFLRNSKLPPKFRAVLTNPNRVIQAQIITVEDAAYWLRESKDPKYI